MNIKRLRFLASWNLSFHWFAVGLVIPVMTLYLLDKGLSLAQVGIAFASYSLATVLLELPTGGLSDTVGRKKVYLFSLFFQIAGAVLLLFAASFPVVLVCFVFQGVSRSLSSGTMDAHFIDEFYRVDPEVNLQQELARIGTFVPVGLGLGSLLGGFIPMTLGRLGIMDSFGGSYASNYMALILALLIQIVTTGVFIREEKRGEGNRGIIAGFRKVPEVVGTSVKYGLGHPVILLLLIAMFAWGFSISGLEQLWQPQVKSIAGETAGSWIYGLLTTGYFLAAALGNMISTPLCRLFKQNYSLVLFLSRAMMGILYFILSMQTGIAFFSFFYIVLFMFNGVQGSPEQSVFNDSVPSDRRSTLISFSSLFLQTGGILGSVAMGYTAGIFSIAAAWRIASVVIMASALLYLFIPFFKEKREAVLKSEF